MLTSPIPLPHLRPRHAYLPHPPVRGRKEEQSVTGEICPLPAQLSVPGGSRGVGAQVRADKVSSTLTQLAV